MDDIDLRGGEGLGTNLDGRNKLFGQRPQQGTKPCRMGRNSIRLSIHPSIRPSICPLSRGQLFGSEGVPEGIEGLPEGSGGQPGESGGLPKGSEGLPDGSESLP